MCWQLMESGACACAGLHGAKLIITGRRQQVLDDACSSLEKEGIQVIGVQVSIPSTLSQCFEQLAHGPTFQDEACLFSSDFRGR